jgi:hypothetical protein
LSSEWLTTVFVKPAMQCGNVDVGFVGHKKGSIRSRTATSSFQNPFLPMQKNLIVFEHFVVRDVLEPSRS